MKVEDCKTDFPKYVAATERMAAIDALLKGNPDNAAELQAERKALDGSWIERRWIETQDIEQGIVIEAEKDAKKAAHDAKKTKLAGWAKTPPQGLPALQAAFAELAQYVNEQLGD